MMNRLRKRLAAEAAPSTNGHAGASASEDPAIVNGQAEAPPKPFRVMIEPLLWTLEQMAQALNVSTRTAKRMAAEGALPPSAVVRPYGRRRLFNRRVIEEWVARGCPPVGRARGSAQRNGRH